MKVLITGSAGKLGKAVLCKLKSVGLATVGADLLESEDTDLILDIRDNNAVGIALEGIDAVIHTAALHGRHHELNYPREAFIETNIQGTLNLLQASVKHAVKAFLYISSTSVYGTSLADAHEAVWVDEELAVQPRDIYDITKYAAEQLCKDFFYKEGLQASVYRVGRFLSEDDNTAANHRLYRGLDERDGAQALYLALYKKFNDFEVFNIAGSSSFTKDELQALKTNPVQVISKYYPDAIDIYKLKNWQFPSSIDRVYITEKAHRLLNFTPKFTFDYLLRN